MRHIHHLLHERIAGFLEPPQAPNVTASQLADEWSPSFEKYLRNRLQMGALRYGPLKTIGKRPAQRVQRAISELRSYMQDRDLERLVDAANMLLCEFEFQTQNGAKLIGKDRI